MRGLSLVAASGGPSSSRCAGLSLSQPLPLRSTGSRCAGSLAVAHGPSYSAACGIFPDQGSNPCPLHWQADSQPLCHQGSPHIPFFIYNMGIIIILASFIFVQMIELIQGKHLEQCLANSKSDRRVGVISQLPREVVTICSRPCVYLHKGFCTKETSWGKTLRGNQTELTKQTLSWKQKPVGAEKSRKL